MDNKNIWPGWETVRLIGRGSFGAVYEIERNVLDVKEKAALKVISIPQSENDIGEMYSDGYDDESITNTFKEHLRSIVDEYLLMKKLSSCPNVVNCDDVRYVQHDDGFGWDIYIKMELLTPLTAALPPHVSDEQVIKIGSDLCRALVMCRQFDIIHRDIKPQNIFVSQLGDYKLGDFGIAKTVEKTSGGTKIGTYKYMAPEVYNNQPYGAGADIYSLGLVLYWLLNERRMPFLPLPPAKLSSSLEEEARLRRFGGSPIPPPAHGSAELKRIVLKACEYDPRDRYHSAEDMLRELEQLGNDSMSQDSDEATVVMPRTRSEEEEDEEDGTMAMPRRCSDEDAEDGTVVLGPESVTNEKTEGLKNRGAAHAAPAHTGRGEAAHAVKNKSGGKSRVLIAAIAGAAVLLAVIIAIFALKPGSGGEPSEEGRWVIVRDATFYGGEPLSLAEYKYGEFGTSRIIYHKFDDGIETLTYTEYEYSRDGNALRSVEYSAGGEMLEYTEYEYNRKGEFILTADYSPDGTLLRKREYAPEKDRHDIILRAYSYEDGVETVTEESEYDHEGKLIKVRSFSVDGSFASISVATYDSSGRIIQWDGETYLDGELMGTDITTLEYDENGNMVSGITSRPDTGNITVNNCSYDEHGNRILSVYTNNGEEGLRSETEYRYFENGTLK